MRATFSRIITSRRNIVFALGVRLLGDSYRWTITLEVTSLSTKPKTSRRRTKARVDFSWATVTFHIALRSHWLPYIQLYFEFGLIFLEISSRKAITVEVEQSTLRLNNQHWGWTINTKIWDRTAHRDIVLCVMQILAKASTQKQLPVPLFLMTRYPLQYCLM
jgi:hypothetical protein